MKVPISHHCVVSAPGQALLGCACPPKHPRDPALCVLSSSHFTGQVAAFSNFYMRYYATFHILSASPGSTPFSEFTRLPREHLVLASKCYTQTVILFLHRKTPKFPPTAHSYQMLQWPFSTP